MRSKFNAKTTIRLKKTTKWIIYAVLILIAFSLSTIGSPTTVLPILLIPLSICISMGENEIPAAITGVFAGLLIDVAASNLLGMNALFMLGVSVLVSLLFLYWMRINLINVLFVTTIATFLNVLYNYFFNYKIWGVEGHNIVFYSKFLPSAIYTVILTPIVYFVVRLVYKNLSAKQRVVIEENNDKIDRV